jgi:hypothetical protein
MNCQDCVLYPHNTGLCGVTKQPVNYSDDCHCDAQRVSRLLEQVQPDLRDWKNDYSKLSREELESHADNETKWAKTYCDEMVRFQGLLELYRELLVELVEFEPTEHCEILGKYDCVFCGCSKSDDGDDTIDHTPDCLITRARALVGGGE